MMDSGVSAPEERAVSFSEAIKVCFNKYANFSGRANRPERLGATAESSWTTPFVPAR